MSLGLPCFEGLQVQTAAGQTVEIGSQNYAPITKGMCLAQFLEFGDSAKDYACPLNRITNEQAANPDTIGGPTGVSLFGPTCREYLVGAAATTTEVQNA
jgi:hypothetical protein